MTVSSPAARLLRFCDRWLLRSFRFSILKIPGASCFILLPSRVADRCGEHSFLFEHFGCSRLGCALSGI